MSDGTIRDYVDIYGNKIYPRSHSDAIIVGDQTLTEYLENIELGIVQQLVLKSPSGKLFTLGATDEGKITLSEVHKE